MVPFVKLHLPDIEEKKLFSPWKPARKPYPQNTGVESSAGVPAAPNNTALPKNKKKNPARARRSRHRLEEYMKRKVNAKMQAESSLAAETSTSKLVIQLNKTKERQDRSKSTFLK